MCLGRVELEVHQVLIPRVYSSKNPDSSILTKTIKALYKNFEKKENVRKKIGKKKVTH